jgi:hypothetical protein
MEMNSNDHGIQEQRRNIKIYEEPELREKRSANLVWFWREDQEVRQEKRSEAVLLLPSKRRKPFHGYEGGLRPMGWRVWVHVSRVFRVFQAIQLSIYFPYPREYHFSGLKCEEPEHSLTLGSSLVSC